jgi:hypothetical protein
MNTDMPMQPDRDEPQRPGASNRPPPAHTTRDLFELAGLDALGLLDDAERRDFEAAFAAASPALKAQLRTQQSLFGAIEETLPQVSPPTSLRARVLAAVAGAISVTRLHDAGRTLPAILPSRGVNRVWRAAAIGFAAAAVVLGFTTLQMRAKYHEMDQAFLTNAASDHFVRDFGTRFEQLLLDPSTRVMAMKHEGPGAAAAAVVLVDDQGKSGFFLARDLPSVAGSFNLVLVGKDGQVIGEPLLSFRPTGSRLVAPISDVQVPDGASFAVQVVSPDGSLTLLRSGTIG